MRSNEPSEPSWLGLVHAEFKSLVGDAGAQAQLMWLPLLGIMIIAAIFYPGVARELPIAVIDADHSASSRALVRHLESNAGLSVVLTGSHPVDGWHAMRDRTVYGTLLIPAGFGDAAKRGKAEPVTFYVNTQYLLIGNMLQSEVMATVMEFSVLASAAPLLARGGAVACIGRIHATAFRTKDWSG
ncbi:MAG: ABC transporter permease [Verrucomicrobia bacterium]|nr:ABC transporter permease [Verrucomicrobiota bacterium]